ncbi:hypothetical protein L7F22_046113 [Adiantum nelumboides]|nr:hypothetical protein [Adiantum nelumboides]MCO5592118.1 hypothetical protein [Adiantum nelumboides]
MLGWCPPPSLQNRVSSSRTCLPQSHETTYEKPGLQPPHPIVIGFDLGVVDSSKSLHTQACDSPRSVLESHRPQSGSPYSPISALGSLLSDRACVASNGLKAEEVSAGERAYQSVMKIERATCGAERVGRYTTSDSVALFNCSRLPVSNNQRIERQSHCGGGREAHSYCTILSSYDEDDCYDCGLDISKSIFSTASPVSSQCMFKDQTMDFLSKCFRCRQKLADGKDIYMYRGDQAFCSQECRYKQIVADERKLQSPLVTPCYPRGSNDHRTVARATQAAFA